MAQETIVSGQLSDSDTPLFRATILVKGTNRVTTTDFDGNYSIKCRVGDTLIYSYVGMETREVRVTQEMLSVSLGDEESISIPVQQIKSSDYQKALDSLQPPLNLQLDFHGKPFKMKDGHTDLSNIKSLQWIGDKDTLILVKHGPKIYFNIEYIGSIGTRSIDRSKLPELQHKYVQGRPQNGQYIWRGPETGEIFSYGPDQRSLVFDGSNYLYDTNGRLIPGSGTTPLPYTNELFEHGLIYKNDYQLALARKDHAIKFRLKHAQQENFYGQNDSRQTVFHTDYHWKRRLKLFFSHSTDQLNQKNLNGFQNNLFLQNFVTPISFQNNQGISVNAGLQRSFSPDEFNNPLWTLARSRNNQQNDGYSMGTSYKFDFKSTTELELRAQYQLDEISTNYGLPNGSVGFTNGYLAQKSIQDQAFLFGADFSERIELSYETDIDFAVKADYVRRSLDYSLTESFQFQGTNFTNPANTSLNIQNSTNGVYRLSNSAKLESRGSIDANFYLHHNAIISGLQGNDLWMPGVGFQLDFNELTSYDSFLNDLIISAEYAEEASEMPLFYSNRSHNSLTLAPEQSQSLLTNADLFNNSSLALEKSTNFEIGLQLILFNHRLRLNGTYFSSHMKDGIFPVLDSGSFVLRNTVDIHNKGFEVSASLDVGGYYGEGLKLTTKLNFSVNRARVKKLRQGLNSLPIAGFNNVSIRMIPSQLTGSIVGSAYQRTEDGQLLIGQDGFPLVDPENQIIGNTTPDFKLAFANTLKFKGWTFDFVLDYQHGGDVWNGTQNLLNYLGRSEESSRLREVSGFVYPGVDTQGNVNTTPVDFSDPSQPITSNRWVRYGYDGVDEDAITDASYLLLRSIGLSYKFDFGINKIFQNLKVGFYANNLMSYTSSKGISPNSSLFGFTNGRGLDFFNTPIVREIGGQIQIKL